MTEAFREAGEYLTRPVPFQRMAGVDILVDCVSDALVSTIHQAARLSILSEVRRSFRHASVRARPAGTPENSPAIYRWVNLPKIPASPVRGERKYFSTQFFRPSGTRHLATLGIPPINRWAIVFRPAGLENGCARFHSKSRFTYSIPCFFKKTSTSSLNVILR